jgi:hypothetical protein
MKFPPKSPVTLDPAMSSLSCLMEALMECRIRSCEHWSKRQLSSSDGDEFILQGLD